MRQILAGHTADQKFGQMARLHAFEPTAHFIGQAHPNGVGRNLAVQYPLECFGLLHDIGQQVVHLQHVDTALAHLGDEIEVVTLGLVHPDHIVEQQLVAVARGQALVRKARRAHHDLAQLAGF